MKTIWHISVSTSNITEEPVIHLLERFFGESASVYHNARTGKSTISVYPQDLPYGLAVVRADLKEALDCLHLGAAKFLIKKLPRENWAESWKRHFKPITIGKALLIKPSWSQRKARPGQRVVVLDPGLSFGTGHHATTSFCLERLVACRRPGQDQSFLDIGTGSGILAISAVKLGYSPVQAFDFDPEAVRVSRQNAKDNGVADRLKPRQQDLTKLPLRSRRRYDVICANLMFDVLVSEAERICGLLKPDGQLILAGILRGQFQRVKKTYSTLGLHSVTETSQKEWQSGQLVFRH